jgi:hypothetical protein
MKTNIFHLSIIPIESILCHEEYDSSRSGPLVERLKKEKHLSNPIIVASLDNGKYLQLDGMNRLSSFKKLGLFTIVAQIIDYNDQEVVELSSWTHLFNVKSEVFFHCADGMERVTIKEGHTENVGHRYIKAEGWGRLCTVVTKKGKVHLISTNGSLPEKIDKLNKFVSCYKDRIVRDVLPAAPNESGIRLLFREHRECNMMIVFPTFTRHQIIEVVKKGVLFPAGVTRHIIKRRCLNVDVPLSLFVSCKSVEAQNREFEKFLKKRPFRVYEEPTIYFE